MGVPGKQPHFLMCKDRMGCEEVFLEQWDMAEDKILSPQLLEQWLALLEPRGLAGGTAENISELPTRQILLNFCDNQHGSLRTELTGNSLPWAYTHGFVHDSTKEQKSGFLPGQSLEHICVFSQSPALEKDPNSICLHKYLN